MNKAKDGGPAFSISRESSMSKNYEGMTLRDYFATKAMPVLLYYDGERLPFIEVADMAYQMADAMIAVKGGETI